ncbi:MAG: SCP2 sterol-binding domain-containing protein [Deltaproteobacteria bacterium]|nr:SCP2 sterol-binding domain-containing protein [Deltaproteobacteria bacterium]
MKSEDKESFKFQVSSFKSFLATCNLQLATGVLRLTPLWIEAIGMGAVMGAIVDGNKRFKERLKEIDDKIFLFEATDLGKRFFLHIKDSDIKIIPHIAKTPDVVMKGETKVFFGLLLGKEDPDTVFFSRRLEISGDTAAAIHFKNILNSMG